ncbi:hypothetical protein MUP35_00785, partial [Patescibacteria group bacterium]|nr:hypothetical protein [Patescibacteria group bacterium]
KELAYRYLRSFLNEKGKSDFFIYKKYIDIDVNFDELKKENEFKKLLNLEGKANCEKQINKSNAKCFEMPGRTEVGCKVFA